MEGAPVYRVRKFFDPPMWRRIGAILGATTIVAAGTFVGAAPAAALGGGGGGGLGGGGGGFGGGWGWYDSRWSSDSNGTTMADVAKTIGSTGTGLTGAGVGIALIDTGVVPVAGLPASQIVNGPDLSFESQGSTVRYLDSFGHGTHLAGIMVGNNPNTGFKGIAPGAKLTSVKVGTGTGAVDVSQVIAALNWVVANRNHDPANPIKVINLAYGTDSTASPNVDPLAFAVENAWKAGIVVVVAGGNEGTALGRLNNPAMDDLVLTVGSVTSMGTPSTADDELSVFSSVSSTRALDVVAPGESIVSLSSPGSYIDLTYPAARAGTGLIRGSGSSQATAVVSGAVALLRQKYPNATPAMIKRLLKSSNTLVTKGANASKTAGQLNVAKAVSLGATSSSDTAGLSTGLGSLDDSRGTSRVADNGVELRGENTVFGPHEGWKWTRAVNAGTAWQGGRWMDRQIAGNGWTGSSWASKTWASTTWSGSNWARKAWTDPDWAGRYWSGSAWAGKSWASNTATDFTGRYWSSKKWS
jgi:serine protease AprX